MRVRAIDGDHDWTFGKGRNNYKKDIQAVAQNIDTRLSMFLGDCFFAQERGIDWFNLLGAKNQLALELAIAATILNTDEVTGLLQLNAELNPDNRRYTVFYRVETSYSTTSSIFTFDTGQL